MAYLDNVYAVVQIAPTGIPTYVRLSQNENGRVLNFAVSGDALPAGSTVALTGTKPDGAVYSASGTLADNVATFNEDEQLTAVAGEWDAKVEVTNSGNLIATGRIKFVIDADPSGGNIPSDSQLDGYIAEMLSLLDAGKAEAYGSPLVASTVAGMIDQNKVYVYTGSETGYTAGNWYYWNGSAWTSGGVYNAVAVSTDTTLSIAGKAADAKATGGEIDALKDDLSHIEGISDEVKQALLACFRGVAWLDWEGSGESLYNALEEALYNEPAPDPRIVYEIPQGTDISTWAIDTEQHAYTLDEDFTFLAKVTTETAQATLSGMFLIDSQSTTTPTVGMRVQGTWTDGNMKILAQYNGGIINSGAGGQTSNSFPVNVDHDLITIIRNNNKAFTVKIYVDGTLEYSDSRTLSARQNTYPPTYYIGKNHGDVERHWLGTVDIYRIYNEALTDAEITSILGVII